MYVKFVVDGKPVAKQRPRVSNVNGNVIVHNTKANLTYESYVRASYLNVMETQKIIDKCVFADRPVFITIVAYFGLSKADYCKSGLSKSGREKMQMKYCTASKGDLDNIVKSILDGLNGVAFKDDAQVVCICAFKKWTTEEERCEVIIEDAIQEKTYITEF